MATGPRRQVVHLRAYAQKKPIDEYKHEAFAMFERMLTAIREDVTGIQRCPSPSPRTSVRLCRASRCARRKRQKNRRLSGTRARLFV